MIIIIIMVSIFSINFRSVVSNLFHISGHNHRRRECKGQSSARRKFRVPGRVATPMDFYTGHLINFSEYTDVIYIISVYVQYI